MIVPENSLPLSPSIKNKIKVQTVTVTHTQVKAGKGRLSKQCSHRDAECAYWSVNHAADYAYWWVNQDVECIYCSVNQA